MCLTHPGPGLLREPGAHAALGYPPARSRMTLSLQVTRPRAHGHTHTQDYEPNWDHQGAVPISTGIGAHARPHYAAVCGPRPTHMSERCVHTQTAGRGRRRLTPGGGGTHKEPPAIPLLYTPHPFPAHGCPPTPTLQTPGNQTANAAQKTGSGPRWSFNVKGKTYPTQTRGPRDTSSRSTQVRAQGPRGPQTEPPPPAHPPPQLPSGTVTCSSS